MYFDFNEINIMIQNMYESKDITLKEFLIKIDIMLRNTKDPILLSSLKSIKEKLLTISSEEFQSIYRDLILTPKEKDKNFPTTDPYEPIF